MNCQSVVSYIVQCYSEAAEEEEFGWNRVEKK